ncbi:MAG: cysteine--tRNA ligase [Nitrososphaerota archaeon]|nr:cysteine--tRNA ligase [Candidatus Calditenuaceae archaeon]MDW8073859.1 cysteine--tRNA ligase [Nitrososphaerota archaeon]
MGRWRMQKPRIYNTLTRSVEVFEPLNPPEVKMYVCGPTVQDLAHLGHAKTYIFFDILYRYLTHLGYRVRYVRNITDVGHLREDTQVDRIVAGAERERLAPMELVDKYMFSFFSDMDRLNIKRPTVQPRATMHIVDMWEAISRLIEKGHAYVVDGNVYFDVSSYERYGQLSGIRREELIKHRVEPAPEKRNPADFALWKRAESGYLLKWSSPWGEGFPGWHIECSIMSIKHLGEQLDIHGGGQDLIFPHHENEIAQSECMTGKRPFVKYWVHVGYLTVRGERMSKSLGNFVSIKDALARYTANDIRLFILSSHYRAPLDYSEDVMEQFVEVRERVEGSYARVLETRAEGGAAGEAGLEFSHQVDSILEGIKASLNDDFNTPRASAHLMELVKTVNARLDSARRPTEGDLEKAQQAFATVFEILGLRQPELSGEGERLYLVIERLLRLREEFRREGNFRVADMIREALREVGVQVEDTSSGPRFRLLR